ncbi:MAG: RNA polymerase sigma factor [Flavobacteriales bacterium]
MEKDAKAFEALYDRYARLLFNYFHRMLWKDREKAKDFTQELFSKIIQKSELYNPERSFKTWLYSIAHNMCKNEYAKHEVRVDAHEQIRCSGNASQQESTSVTMDKASFKEDLALALSELDAVKRTTFELRFYQEMSVQEISEAMECSEGTVKSRLFYTLKELNSKLKIYEHILKALLILMNLLP